MGPMQIQYNFYSKRSSVEHTTLSSRVWERNGAPTRTVEQKSTRSAQSTRSLIDQKSLFVRSIQKHVHHDDNGNIAACLPQMLVQLMRLHHWNKHIDIGKWLANGFHCQLARVCICLTNIRLLFGHSQHNWKWSLPFELVFSHVRDLTIISSIIVNCLIHARHQCQPHSVDLIGRTLVMCFLHTCNQFKAVPWCLPPFQQHDAPEESQVIDVQIR